DIADPATPKTAGTWWHPGQHKAGGETYTPEDQRKLTAGRPYPQHGLSLHGGAYALGDRAYCPWIPGPLVIPPLPHKPHPRPPAPRPPPRPPRRGPPPPPCPPRCRCPAATSWSSTAKRSPRTAPNPPATSRPSTSPTRPTRS